MSAAIFAREGYAAALDAFASGLVWWVRLYTNDPAVGAGSVRADFVEAAYDGYAPYHIPKWTPAALRGGSAFAVPDIPHFVATGPDYGLPIRGYYVTWGADGPLAMAWRRPGVAFQFGLLSPILTVFLRLQFPFPPV